MQRIMRSFTSCQAAVMERLFRLSLLLTYLSVIESAGKPVCCLSQPDDVIWKKIGQDVVLACTVSCSQKDLRYVWFLSQQKSHLCLNLDSNHHKYSLNGASLHINSLNTNDSGIYHCAVVSNGPPALGAQYIGMGTTLEVNGVIKTTLKNILLWLTFVLLVIYSLAVVTLIILKKHGYNICASKRMYTSDKNHSTRKTQFRDVLQEMVSKRNLEINKQTVSRNRSQVEAASTDFNSSIDDIYQNV